MTKSAKNSTKYLVLAPIVSVVLSYILMAAGLSQAEAITAGITLLTVIWWVTEALPIPATSIVPFALFPLFGILDHKAAASALGSHVILLLMGAFMLSKALEKSGAHERLALYMVNLVGGGSGRRLVFGFMLATTVLSMWISNTATVLIMLPIALAIVHHIECHKTKVALILGIAYSASLAGVATPIGTPPNVIFMGIYQETTGTELTFLDWMKVGFPVVLIMLPLMGLWLTRSVGQHSEISLPEQGKWRVDEKRVICVFAFAALAWITRKEPFGGWSHWFDMPNAGDSTVALVAAVLMFVIPNGKNSRLLDWDTAKTIPWGMLLLFAGGIVIAKAFGASGLSESIGNWLASMANLPIVLIVLVICLVVTYLTEITSNTATATLLMPILASTAIAADMPPELLMVPATICASCAFMFPVATAPNAIAYSTGEVQIKEMIREGFVLSMMAGFVVTGVVYFVMI